MPKATPEQSKDFYDSMDWRFAETSAAHDAMMQPKDPVVEAMTVVVHPEVLKQIHDQLPTPHEQ
jgi:hypothetical protein